MSPSPQLAAVDLRLTKKSPPPRTGVGQKSSAAELTGSPRFSGAPNGASVLSRCATQMSSSPCPPGRFEAMYRLSPSGDWIGQPSSDGVFSSELLPAISSTFWAGAQAEKCIASATATAGTSARDRERANHPGSSSHRHSSFAIVRSAVRHTGAVAVARLISSGERVTVQRLTGRLTAGGRRWA